MQPSEMVPNVNQASAQSAQHLGAQTKEPVPKWARASGRGLEHAWAQRRLTQGPSLASAPKRNGVAGWDVHLGAINVNMVVLWFLFFLWLRKHLAISISQKLCRSYATQCHFQLFSIRIER